MTIHINSLDSRGTTRNQELALIEMTGSGTVISLADCEIVGANRIPFISWYGTV